MEIELVDVSVVFEKGTDVEKGALRNLTISFSTNDRLLLVGETGSGKTTLVYLLDLLLKPSEGALRFDGVDPFVDPYRYRKEFGVAFQIPERQFFNETVEEEITYACRNFRIPYTKEDLAGMLNLVGLDVGILGKSPFRLSGGEQRKVALASVLLHKPKFLLLDEPTAGLDLRGVYAVLRILEGFRERGIGYLVATHDPELFDGLWNVRVELRNGEIAEVERR